MANTGGRRDDWRTTAQARNGRPAAAGDKPRRRWVLASLVVALLVGVALSFLVFLKPPVEPLCFAVPVGEYHKVSDSRWPANAWAEADALGLRDRFPADGDQGFHFQEKTPLLRELAGAVKKAGEQKRPLVVYLTALGTVHAGKPYLLPADAQPDSPASWVGLDDVLDPVRGGGTERLLVLDVRPVRSPRAALPTDDVNELIDARLAALHAADDLPFLVLTANTAPAGPLALPTVRHTAFGLALDRGLRGAADGWLSNGQKDSAVSARELAAYARECTSAATAAAQRPQVYGHGADFKLTNVSPTAPAPPDPEPRPAYPKFLADAWADADLARQDKPAAWADADPTRKDGLPARAPRAMRQHTDAAVDAERWWLAGFDESTVKGRYGTTLAAFRQELAGTALGPVRPTVASVARARSAVPGFDAQAKAAAAALEEVFQVLKSPAYAAARTTDPTKAQELWKVKLAAAKLPEGLTLPAAVAAAYEAAEKNPTPAVVRGLVEVLDTVKFADRPPVAELATLQAVALLPDYRDPKWVADVVPAWLATAAAAEQAVLFDPRGLPKVKGRLDGLEGRYREEVAAMVDPRARPDRLDTSAGSLRALRTEYAAVRADGEALGKAWQAVGGARAALADLADRYPHELARQAGGQECSLAPLTEAYSDVVTALTGDTPPDLPKLENSTYKLADGLKKLTALGPPPAQADWAAVQSALDWPGWTADARVKLLDRLYAFGDQAVSAWPTAPSGREPPAPPKAGQVRVFAESQRVLRNRTELVSVWDPTFARGVRTALDAGLPPAKFSDRDTQVTAARQAAPAGRPLFGWAISSQDVPPLPAGEVVKSNPELAARREAERAYERWLAEARYRKLSTAIAAFDTPATPGGGERYAAAARRYKGVADAFPQ